MKTLLVKRNFLVCALWLLTCCTAAASNNNRRTMWVDTTGEDSPQCIHDMPASVHGPVPLLHQPCRSVNYALRNIQNETINTIFISCGVHVFEPFDGLDAAPLLNATTIVIEGTCTDADEYKLPSIRCNDGANMALYNVQKVVIKHLSFRDCGEQLQPSDSLSDSSTLYFQDCKTVVIQDSLITVTGPYGSGISLIKNDPTSTHVNVHIGFVYIQHFGIRGTGIHFEVLTAMTRDIYPASVKFDLHNTDVLYVNYYPSYDQPTTTFTGINITLMGDREGGEIILSNVTIRRTTRSNGILMTMLDRVHSSNAQLTNISIITIMGLKTSNNITVKYTPCDEQLSTISQSAAINSAPYFGIKIECRGNSAGNHIQVRMFYADECRGIPGSAFSIEITDESAKNVVQLSVFLTGGYKRGLQVILTGWARGNNVQMDGIHCSGHRALLGAGGYFEFSGHAQRNLINLRHSTFNKNHALRGGGIAVVCKDFATQNRFKVLRLDTYHNSAELGGGVYAILQDSSIGNLICSTNISLLNNTAHCGGGMFIHIQDTTAENRVVIIDSTYVKNTLLPSEVHAMMGGGVHVEFSTVRATFRTNNRVIFMFCGFLMNTAGQKGIGGGISVLYKHSLYQGESGDMVNVYKVRLFHNMAASGSACAFQSLPTQGKRLFRGVRLTYINAYLITTSAFQTMDDAELLVMFHFHLDRYMTGLDKESEIRIQKELSQTIMPSFQVATNTNFIFAKSVQITVGHLFIVCGASTQGIYALDSEIVLRANTESMLVQCVATHGGAIALYGESYIRVGKNTTLELYGNHAFQRGGAIYVSSAPGVVPVSNCFLQHDREWERSNSAIIFSSNTAKAEGQSVYVSEIRNCFSENRQSIKNIN